jgi:glycerol kinase
MNIESYILAIDQSTSATKTILFDRNAHVVHRVTIEHKQYYPHPGFVEHDAEEIYLNTKAGIQQLLQEKEVDESQISCIAITNQRETALIWDRITGKPVANAVVWQCQRGAAICNELREKGFDGMVKARTGLMLDPYFSAGKLHWLMNNIDGLKEKAMKGDLLLGTMDTWLVWKLTGGKVHATDYSNACRTLLFNIHKLKWDEELVELFDLNETMLPEVKCSNEVFGHTSPEEIFKHPIPISGLMGDSHAALFGQNCFSPGMAKATYGTGSSIMMNIGEKPIDAPNGLVTSIGYGIDKKIFYVFEGNIHCTGDTINWLKNDVELIKDASETEALAHSVENNNGVYLVPAFAGLGAPYWDNQARACLSGMLRNTRKAHIARAALESIAYQVKDLIDPMQKEGGVELILLRVDGGPTRNRFLMQFQSDMLNREIDCSDVEEASALGAALMAGLATGFWSDISAIMSLRRKGITYSPKMNQEERNRLYEGWKKAVERTRL